VIFTTYCELPQRKSRDCAPLEDGLKEFLETRSKAVGESQVDVNQVVIQIEMEIVSMNDGYFSGREHPRTKGHNVSLQELASCLLIHPEQIGWRGCFGNPSMSIRHLSSCQTDNARFDGHVLYLNAELNWKLCKEVEFCRPTVLYLSFWHGAR
jgi:hypothetical protein